MRQFASHFILLLILVSAGVLIWLSFNNEPVQEPRLTEKKRSAETSTVISGLSYDNYLEGQLVSRIAVAQFTIHPRKFGIFRVKALNEAFLVKAKFDLYHSANAASLESAKEDKGLSLTGGLAESIDGLASIRGMGHITQGVIQPIEINVFRDRVPYLNVIAQRAVLNIKKGQMEFENARIVANQGDLQVVSERLVWDENRKVFLLPGDYRRIVKTGVEKGRRAIIDADMRLLPMP